MSAAAAAVLIIELLVLIAICGLVLRVFCSFKRTPWYALISTMLGWILCFSIALLVPIDIVDADHEQCMKDNNNDESICREPIAYLPPAIMTVQWSVLYWGTLVMSWLGFPILQTYSLAGDFTPWEKFVRSLKENIFLYLGMAVVGIIAVVGLAIVKKASGVALLNFIMLLANAYGLVLVVVLMGYGLVDIPRYLFKKASRERMLVHYHAQASKFKETMDTSKEQLDKTLRQVKKVSDRVKDHDPYRPYVDTILKKCPLEYDDVAGEGDSGDITYDKLVQLNARVKDDTHSVARAVCLYEMLLRKAFAIEDIIKLKEEGGSPDHKIHYSFRQPRTYKYANYVDTFEYYWELYFHTVAYLAMGVGSVILSLLVVWCEITLVVPIDLSPFSQIIIHSQMQGFGKQLFCFIPLSYMALCAYTTLFKIKLFNYYRLVPHQQSDANSIMFSANYLCRLAAPLSYNFLKLINQEDSSFAAVMGEMDAFPLGKDFQIFFPIFVAVLCLFTIFNVWGKIASMCCIKRLRYVPDDDYKLITEGEQILRDERAIKEGRGPTKKSFKEDLKSTIKDATRKFLPKKDEETGNPPPQAAQAPAAPQAELTAVQKLRGKYTKFEGGADGADLLPTGSKFATVSAATSTTTSTSTSTSSHTTSSSSYNTITSKSRNSTYNDLLPPTSRFSKNSAIVSSSSSSSLDMDESSAAAKIFARNTQSSSTSSNSNNTSSQQKSVFGSLFGKNGGKNDEIGLLPRGFAKSDSTIV